MCRTRWVQRIDAIQVFRSLHKSTVACMESIYNDGPGQWSADSLTDARSLQLAISTTDFICALVITNSCLKYLQALTTNLQAETKGIVTAVKEINSHCNSTKSQRQYRHSPFTKVLYSRRDVHISRHLTFFASKMWETDPS